MQLEGKSIWVMAKGFAPDEGGHQTYAEQVALAYARLGAKVIVFGQTSAGPRDVTHGPLKLVDIGPGKSPLVPLRLVAALRREVRQSGRPEILHATTWRTAVPAIIAGFAPVVTFHGREFMFAPGVVRYVMQQIFERARLVVAVSHYSAARLKERVRDSSRVVTVAWNGSSIQTSASEKQDNPPIILSLCRLEPRKNISNAVRAAAILRDRGCQFQYFICGRGPETAEIAALIEGLQLGEHVKMLGFVSNDQVADLYGSASIFLHPHISVDHDRDFEGFGIVIADAMRAGCAVVIGAGGGAPELVEESISGHVVDGNDVSQIANRLAKLLDHRDRIKFMGVAAKERATRYFTWDRHVRLILDELNDQKSA